MYLEPLSIGLNVLLFVTFLVNLQVLKLLCAEVLQAGVKGPCLQRPEN
jgi:hypothetical protein